MPLLRLPMKDALKSRLRLRTPSPVQAVAVPILLPGTLSPISTPVDGLSQKDPIACSEEKKSKKGQITNQGPTNRRQEMETSIREGEGGMKRHNAITILNCFICFN